MRVAWENMFPLIALAHAHTEVLGIIQFVELHSGLPNSIKTITFKDVIP